MFLYNYNLYKNIMFKVKSNELKHSNTLNCNFLYNVNGVFKKQQIVYGVILQYNKVLY